MRAPYRDDYGLYLRLYPRPGPHQPRYSPCPTSFYATNHATAQTLLAAVQLGRVPTPTPAGHDRRLNPARPPDRHRLRPGDRYHLLGSARLQHHRDANGDGRGDNPRRVQFRRLAAHTSPIALIKAGLRLRHGEDDLADRPIGLAQGVCLGRFVEWKDVGNFHAELAALNKIRNALHSGMVRLDQHRFRT
jgi:hypothetical protein